MIDARGVSGAPCSTTDEEPTRGLPDPHQPGARSRQQPPPPAERRAGAVHRARRRERRLPWRRPAAGPRRRSWRRSANRRSRRFGGPRGPTLVVALGSRTTFRAQAAITLSSSASPLSSPEMTAAARAELADLASFDPQAKEQYESPREEAAAQTRMPRSRRLKRPLAERLDPSARRARSPRRAGMPTVSRRSSR